MKQEQTNNYLLRYIESLQTHGKYTFSIEQVRNEFRHTSKMAIKIALIRLSKKKKIISIHKGFYVIIPPEYASKGILPPFWFIDSLMRYLEKPYYVGLLSAAALHGAAHQQPQEFFIITNLPVLRPKMIKGLKINFVAKSKILQNGLENKKTETGYIKVSSPELTAIDIVLFENRIGGIDRVATLLDELLDVVDPVKLKALLRKNIPLAIIQRLGFISEKVLDKNKVSSVLSYYLKNKELLRVPLEVSGNRSGFPIDPDWKIIINAKPESDL